MAEKLQIQLLDEYEFEKGEDAPLSMASHTELSNLQCYWPSVRFEYAQEMNSDTRLNPSTTVT